MELASEGEMSERDKAGIEHQRTLRGIRDIVENERKAVYARGPHTWYSEQERKEFFARHFPVFMGTPFRQPSRKRSPIMLRAMPEWWQLYAAVWITLGILLAIFSAVMR